MAAVAEGVEPDSINIARVARTELNHSAVSERLRGSQLLGATEMVSFHKEIETATVQLLASGSGEDVESKTRPH